MASYSPARARRSGFDPGIQAVGAQLLGLVPGAEREADAEIPRPDVVQPRVGTFGRHPALSARQPVVERQQSMKSPALSGRCRDLSPCSKALG